MYMCFSKTPALSPTGDARPFDAEGDGTILGEGLGILALKRLDDARRDGDRIYAVIKSVGASSDGKGQAVYAPSAAGQAQALRQAYRLAGISPATVELVEAHGTGTKVGDATELAALAEVYREAAPEGTWCALGSVKSQIGHTKAAAGAAGLIKAALALHRKVLPPTAKVTRPIAAAAPGRSPFYVNAEPAPLAAPPRPPPPRRRQRLRLRRQQLPLRAGGGRRRAAGDRLGRRRADPRAVGRRPRVVAPGAGRPARRPLLGGPATRGGPVPRPVPGRAAAPAPAGPRARGDGPRTAPRRGPRPAVGLGRPALRRGPRRNLPGRRPGAGGLALLFPGQGSQYVGMLRALACRFPAVQEALAEAEGALGDDGRRWAT
jgi:acyl transferase domain-containing protein